MEDIGTWFWNSNVDKFENVSTGEFMDEDDFYDYWNNTPPDYHSMYFGSSY